MLEKISHDVLNRKENCWRHVTDRANLGTGMHVLIRTPKYEYVQENPNAKTNNFSNKIPEKTPRLKVWEDQNSQL